jgi:hypothetical protein
MYVSQLTPMRMPERHRVVNCLRFLKTERRLPFLLSGEFP